MAGRDSSSTWPATTVRLDRSRPAPQAAYPPPGGRRSLGGHGPRCPGAASLPFAVGDGPIGATLRDLRAARGMSQRGLARRLSRPHSIVSRWEAGTRQPTTADLDALARILRVCPAAILERGWDGSPRRWSSRAHDWRARVVLGRHLESARLAAGVTRTVVVIRTGVRGRRIARIEAGADPGLAEVGALLSLYGRTLCELLLDVRLDSSRFRHMVPPSRLRLTADTLATPPEQQAM